MDRRKELVKAREFFLLRAIAAESDGSIDLSLRYLAQAERAEKDISDFDKLAKKCAP
jgi:hypothetical protein